VASFRSALNEATIEAKRHPSSQAFMVKGMAELNLQMWEEARKSFAKAFSYGFEKGEEWAEQVSILGLAVSLQESGLEDSASRMYSYLIDRSKFRPVCVLAAEKYIDITLIGILNMKGEEKQKELFRLLRRVEKLSSKDLSCSYYHYLQSQIYSHLGDYRKSFEEAVMARELGLPKEEIFRDNDLQIVFCYDKLREKLTSEKWQRFQSIYREWVKRWGWKDHETPDWK